MQIAPAPSRPVASARRSVLTARSGLAKQRLSFGYVLGRLVGTLGEVIDSPALGLGLPECIVFDTVHGMEPILAVKFYRTDAGTEPVREWLKALTVEDRKTIGTDIKEVQFGWPLGMPLVRKMGPGLWEVRSHIVDGIARILFTVTGAQMVLLHGFVKKATKTPSQDLDTAKARAKRL